MDAANAEATILGIADTGNDDPAGKDFEVRPAGDFDLHGLEAEVTAPRNLDAELEGFGLDDLQLPGQAEPSVAPDAPDSAPLPPAEPTPAAAASAAPSEEVWTLNESDAVSEKTAPTLSLQLEIEGLSGELRSVVGSLLGKVVSLPPLRIRIKGDDLG